MEMLIYAAFGIVAALIVARLVLRYFFRRDT